MSADPVLDGIADVLRSVEPPFATVIIGRPRNIVQSRTASVWFAGTDDDANQTMGLSCIGRTELIEIGIFWKDDDADQVRQAVEYDVRKVVIAVEAAIHNSITLAGVINSLWIAPTTTPWTQLGGATFRMALFELRAMTLSSNTVGG